VSILVNQDKTLLTYVLDNNARKTIPISCLIREHRVKPDAHPMDSGGKLYPQYYQPQFFPVGRWRVTRIDPETDPYMAPFFIATDAHQLVECLDGTVVEDWGYGIHHSTSRTTWGCLNVLSEDDLRWLVVRVKIGDEVNIL
jgi:hypothetical protein